MSTPPPPPLLSRGANTVIALQDELNAACGVNLNIFYDKFSIKPPGGGIFISSPFERGGGGLIETKGLFERGGLFNLDKTMVSVLYKQLEHKVEKLSSTRSFRSCSQGS